MLLLNIERSISKSKLAKYKNAYSTEMRIPYKEALKKGLLQEEDSSKSGGSVVIYPEDTTNG